MGWRHGNASKHVWSDRATLTTLAQTQLNGSRSDSFYEANERRCYALTKGGCSGLGLHQLVCRLESEATTHCIQMLRER